MYINLIGLGLNFIGFIFIIWGISKDLAINNFFTFLGYVLLIVSFFLLMIGRVQGGLLIRSQYFF